MRNAEVSPQLKYPWLQLTKQLRTVKVPRSINKSIRMMNAVQLHIFADTSIGLLCSSYRSGERRFGRRQGFLGSKSRISKRHTSISRLELVCAHMAANMARNLCNALRAWPIKSVTVWMNSLVGVCCQQKFVPSQQRKLAGAAGNEEEPRNTPRAQGNRNCLPLQRERSG